jgi:hypothetical protein
MSTVTYEHTFKVGQSVFVLPTVEQLQSSMSDELAKIIYRASNLLFIRNPKIKDKYYEYYPNESRLTVFLKPSRSHITRCISFLTMKEFPILFACPHYLYELDMPHNKMFKNLFLLLKFRLYNEWLMRDQEDRIKIYSWIKANHERVIRLRPNFNAHMNMRTDKWHESVGKFERHLRYKKDLDNVLMTLEKACFEVEG